MLTLKQLESMPPETAFATGTGLIPGLHRESRVRWVAVRGGGIPDWAIYYHHAIYSVEDVKRSGDKCFTEEVIKELVSCTSEAYNMYRH